MMFLLPVSLFSSSFDLIRHVPSFSLVGPLPLRFFSDVIFPRLGQLYLQHLVFVTPLQLPGAIVDSSSSTIAAGSCNSVTDTRFCRYSCMHPWWWVDAPLETCTAVSGYNKLCNVACSWIYLVYWNSIKIMRGCGDKLGSAWVGVVL